MTEGQKTNIGRTGKPAFLVDSNVLRIHGQGTHLNILQDDYLKPALSLGIYPRSAKDKIPTIEVSDGAVLETHSYIDVGSIEAVGEVHRESYGKLVVNNAYVLID